jgi:hypothetical protein
MILDALENGCFLVSSSLASARDGIYLLYIWKRIDTTNLMTLHRSWIALTINTKSVTATFSSAMMQRSAIFSRVSTDIIDRSLDCAQTSSEELVLFLRMLKIRVMGFTEFSGSKM